MTAANDTRTQIWGELRLVQETLLLAEAVAGDHISRKAAKGIRNIERLRELIKELVAKSLSQFVDGGLKSRDSSLGKKAINRAATKLMMIMVCCGEATLRESSATFGSVKGYPETGRSCRTRDDLLPR